MNLLVSVEHRFDRSPDGSVWTQTTYAYPFWTRYLEVFDSVVVLARVRDVNNATQDCMPASGPGVSFCAVPHYLGPYQYALRAREVNEVVAGAAARAEAVILRVPSHVSNCLERKLKALGHPFWLEVLGDPRDALGPGAMKSLFRPYFRWSFARHLRLQCRRASGAAYVTERALQRRYPARGYSVGASDVELPEEAIVDRSRVYSHRDEFTAITVGSMALLYKAPDILIRAIALCAARGLRIRLKFVGDGQHRAELEQLAMSLGIRDSVEFLGQLPQGERVRAQLDGSDIFVLPSRQEGLPRAMVEAMARAMPCIGSTVGGFPELLPEEDMVPPGDAEALAAKLHEVLTDEDRLARMSVLNLEKAQCYRTDVLHDRRLDFYRLVRDYTRAWQTGEWTAPVAAAECVEVPLSFPRAT